MQCKTPALIATGLLALFSGSANAHRSYSIAIEADGDAQKAGLPAISQPQADWSKVSDLQSTDGTVAVPPCSEPRVVATVRDGIVSATNSGFQAAGGTGILVHKVEMNTVWVHPTSSGGYLCDMRARVDIPFSEFNDWKFQTYAIDGNAAVAFFDADDPL